MLRVSVVEYLNTAPLVWGFTQGPLAGRYELDFTVPSRCAEALRQGQVDIGIIPAIEYQRMEGMVVLPEMAIAAKGEVRSILLVSKKPIELARRIALDTSSRSSDALVRILATERWGIQPEYVEALPDPATMLSAADAALVIGDPALRIALKMDALAEKKTGGEFCCQGDPSELPVPGYDTVFIYDVAYEWKELTGRPCVLAVWAGRRRAVTPEVVEDFLESKAYGLAHLDEIVEDASLELDLATEGLGRYLRENIDYSLDAENQAGLEHYFERCAQAGLIDRVKPVEFAPRGAARDARAAG
jgi:chorismate dehydratase